MNVSIKKNSSWGKADVMGKCYSNYEGHEIQEWLETIYYLGYFRLTIKHFNRFMPYLKPLLDFYKFFEQHKIETRWDGDELLAWIDHWALSEFTKTISGTLLDDGGRACRLQSGGTVCIDLVPICEYYGIEAERVVPKSR